MRVIDLLNKIANGEEVPKKIKVGDYYYEFYERLDNYYNYKKIDIDSGEYFDDYLCDTYFLDNKVVLNWEVEIIEEDKKIEKLEHWINVKSWVEGADLEKGLEEQSEFNKNIYYKINEIIDKINKGE